MGLARVHGRLDGITDGLRGVEIGFADAEGDDAVGLRDEFKEVADAGTAQARHVTRDEAGRIEWRFGSWIH